MSEKSRAKRIESNVRVVLDGAPDKMRGLYNGEYIKLEFSRENVAVLLSVKTIQAAHAFIVSRGLDR